MHRPDDETNRLVRASLVISSFCHCVQELLFNSVGTKVSSANTHQLDACATRVEVSLDYQSMSVEVRDNGHGISEELMSQLGQHNGTLKSVTPNFSEPETAGRARLRCQR